MDAAMTTQSIVAKGIDSASCARGRRNIRDPNLSPWRRRASMRVHETAHDRGGGVLRPRALCLRRASGRARVDADPKRRAHRVRRPSMAGGVPRSRPRAPRRGVWRRRKRGGGAPGVLARAARERREALLPFFWRVIARRGQIFGNQTEGSLARDTNGLDFSYPGYNEMLTGHPDSRMNTNDPVPNPNRTVFEWLNACSPACGAAWRRSGPGAVFDADLQPRARSGLAGLRRLAPPRSPASRRPFPGTLRPASTEHDDARTGPTT